MTNKKLDLKKATLKVPAGGHSKATKLVAVMNDALRSFGALTHFSDKSAKKWHQLICIVFGRVG